MSRHEHYEKAEQLLREAEEHDAEQASVDVQIAQVHALLAIATALLPTYRVDTVTAMQELLQADLPRED